MTVTVNEVAVEAGEVGIAPVRRPNCSACQTAKIRNPQLGHAAAVQRSGSESVRAVGEGSDPGAARQGIAAVNVIESPDTTMLVAEAPSDA